MAMGTETGQLYINSHTYQFIYALLLVLPDNAKLTKEEKMKNLTPKQDGFCLSYIETGNASESYRRNYSVEKMKPATVKKRASELLNNRDITGTIQQLRKDHSERHNITVDGITTMYKAVIADSTASKQFGPTVAAITGLARLHGLLTDKVEVAESSIASRLATARKLRKG
jgi:hypothetical protein